MKTTEFIILSIFILFLGAITFVKDIFPEGNKDMQGEFRSTSDFNQVASFGEFKVTVKHGDTYAVEIWAESNLLPFIETKVVGKTLKIKTRGFRRFVQNYPIEVSITTPVLDGLYLSGSGMVKTENFTSSQFSVAISGSGDIYTKVITDNLKAQISGSGNIFLEGNAKVGRFLISGSGKIKSYQAQQRNCEAVILGSGNMYVNTQETIDARISGSGKVLYINNPIISKSIYGTGDVFNNN